MEFTCSPPRSGLARDWSVRSAGLQKQVAATSANTLQEAIEDQVRSTSMYTIQTDAFYIRLLVPKLHLPSASKQLFRSDEKKKYAQVRPIHSLWRTSRLSIPSQKEWERCPKDYPNIASTNVITLARDRTRRNALPLLGPPVPEPATGNE